MLLNNSVVNWDWIYWESMWCRSTKERALDYVDCLPRFLTGYLYSRMLQKNTTVYATCTGVGIAGTSVLRRADFWIFFRERGRHACPTKLKGRSLFVLKTEDNESASIFCATTVVLEYISVFYYSTRTTYHSQGLITVCSWLDVRHIWYTMYRCTRCPMHHLNKQEQPTRPEIALSDLLSCIREGSFAGALG